MKNGWNLLKSRTLMLGLLSLLVACGKAVVPTAATSITLRGIQNLGTLNGGVMLYGYGSNPANHFAMSLSDETQNAEINLKHDTYNFYAIGWDGAYNLEGEARCAQSTSVISGTEATVALTLSRANCENDVFAAAGDRTGTGASTSIKVLTLVGCKTLDPTFTGAITTATTCDDSNANLPYFLRGEFRSYKVRMKTFNSSSSDLSSRCLATLVSNNTARVFSSVKVPLSSMVNYPTEIVGYKTHDCTEPSNNIYADDVNFSSYHVHFPQGIKSQNSGVEAVKLVGGASITIIMAENPSGSAQSPLSLEMPYSLALTSASGVHRLNDFSFTEVPVRALPSYSGYGVRVPNTANLYDLSCTITSSPGIVASTTCNCNALNCSYNFMTTTSYTGSNTATFTISGRNASGSLTSNNENLFLGFKGGPSEIGIQTHEYMSKMIGWPSIFNARIKLDQHGGSGTIQQVFELLGPTGLGGLLYKKGFTSCGTLSAVNETKDIPGGTEQLIVYGSTGDINPFTASAFTKKLQLIKNIGSKTETIKLSFTCSGGTPQGHLRVAESGYDENSDPYSRKTEFLYNMATAMPVAHFYEREVQNTTNVYRRYQYLKKVSSGELRLWSIHASNASAGGETLFGAINYNDAALYSMSEYHATNTSSAVGWSGSTMLHRSNGNHFGNYAASAYIASTYVPGFALPVPIKNAQPLNMIWLKALDNNSACSPVTPGTGVYSDFDCDLE